MLVHTKLPISNRNEKEEEEATEVEYMNVIFSSHLA